MIGGGKLAGLIMMVASALAFLGFFFWAQGTVEDAGGFRLGILLAMIILAPIFGIGAYLFRKGSVEGTQFAQVQQEKKLLNMVLTQGQINISEIVAEMQLPRETIEEMIRNVVGKQLFSGAIDWKRGILYSVESQQLTDSKKCPNCGSELSFAGKGLITCDYCGTEVFLTKRAAAQTAHA